MTSRTSLSIVGVGWALVACAAPDMQGTPVGADTPAPAPVVHSTSGSCSAAGAALAPADPGQFPKCACAAGGAARCIAKAIVPADQVSSLDACAAVGDGVCVPDKLVQSGGAAPKTCKSPFGEGRCMSLCVPEVAKNAAVLNRGEGDVCDADERCAPCLDPLKNNAPTGVCEIGAPSPVDCGGDGSAKGGGATGGSAPAPVQCPYSGPPLVDVTTFPSCGAGARCVPAAVVPVASQPLLGACPTGLCAPEKSVAAGGQYLPKVCSAVASAEGRCVNVNIPAIAAQRAMLQPDVCDPDELCAPCFNPLDGTDTGACRSVTCDAPKEPARTFTACCSARAKCVPTALVPSARRSNLDDGDGACQQGQELCVPNEMLDPAFRGPACQGSTFFTGSYSGVCLSDCLDFDFFESLGISRGSCPNGSVCAPCRNPLTGASTGAPGCPGT